MNFRENMASLNTLSNDHYNNRVTFLEYRQKRTQLLKLIDEDLNAVVMSNEDNIEKIEEIKEESFVDKALSFLKK